MKNIIIGWYLLVSTLAFAQNEIPWDNMYQLQLSDFQSAATQIGSGTIYSVHTASGMEFSFYMSSVAFMFTKNFNGKVNNAFKRDAASIVAPTAAMADDLLHFAQFEFDLSELYARKFRKKLYEEKGTFSNVSFFKPIFDGIQKEFSERDTNAGKATDLGRKKEKLQQLHEQVLKEIEALGDFCKECQPPKKK